MRLYDDDDDDDDDDDFQYGWPRYVTVAERQLRAKKKLEALRKTGVDVQPVALKSRKIATTFWGQAWCEHLESFSDFANRLPRGRSYVRNGSVCHLQLTGGTVEARVAGTSLYTVRVAIKKLPAAKWRAIKQQVAGRIGSLLELLRGRLSDQVMAVVTDRAQGLFPLPREISFQCDCPDWASMCKHIAAVMYGVGARLDQRPELLFTLRGVNHDDLIVIDAAAAIAADISSVKSRQVAASDLSDVFGIDLDSVEPTGPATGKRPRTSVRTTPVMKPARKKLQAKKPGTKKAPTKKAKKKGAQKKFMAKPVPRKQLRKKTGRGKKPH